MAVLPAARSPRLVAGIALALLCLPSALLAALGWQLYKQDRASRTDRRIQAREQTADLVVATLDRQLAAARLPQRSILSRAEV